MPLAAPDIAHTLLAITALMMAAHGSGAMFARLRQPRVIGEIVGGLLLGPTLLGALAPGQQRWLFPADGPVSIVLGLLQQLGLLLLMFCSGMEIRSAFHRREGKTVASIFVTGTVLPFAAAVLLLLVVDERQFYGPAGNPTSFLLVFAVAMAVTSIPVISRIMYDLGILDTAFARVVLGVAVIEDILLYVILAIALGIVAETQGGLFGLPSAIGLRAGSVWDVLYHAAATLGILGLFLVLGGPVYKATSRLRSNLTRQRSPVAYQLVYMLAACLACMVLGVQPFFGAFVAGMVVGASEDGTGEAVEAIKSFSFAFFVPIYFAVVGLQLDLLHGFSPLHFAFYFALACLIKAFSVHVGARMAGESPASSWNLAVAMNARGGPGIVLASLAYAAGIVSQPFFAMLVMLAILTSLLAGSWLERVPRDQLLVREYALPRTGDE
jgi:K+:H+ antiporter